MISTIKLGSKVKLLCNYYKLIMRLFADFRAFLFGQFGKKRYFSTVFSCLPLIYRQLTSVFSPIFRPSDNKKEMLGQISHSVSMPVHPVERRYL